MIRLRVIVALVLALLAAGAPAQSTGGAQLRAPDVFYLPTTPPVVRAMLRLAKVTRSDVVYDLGCGDGRIVIEAARRYGAHAVGIDIDPERIAEAKANARKAGVDKLVDFRLADLFEADLRGATVVTLYLLPSLNLKLMPKLRSELPKGARIVSHDFEMGDWKPERSLDVGNASVYLWIIR